MHGRGLKPRSKFCNSINSRLPKWRVHNIKRKHTIKYKTPDLPTNFVPLLIFKSRIQSTLLGLNIHKHIHWAFRLRLRATTLSQATTFTTRCIKGVIATRPGPNLL
ncbi:hypothetical protein LguiB_020045 [Lonicera macranthoides]